MSERESLTITAFGSDPGKAMPQVADATIRLLEAVAVDQLGEDAASISWRIGAMAWCCDVCGERLPEKPVDWTNDGRYDYCGACTMEAMR